MQADDEPARQSTAVQSFMQDTDLVLAVLRLLPHYPARTRVAAVSGCRGLRRARAELLLFQPTDWSLTQAVRTQYLGFARSVSAGGFLVSCAGRSVAETQRLGWREEADGQSAVWRGHAELRVELEPDGVWAVGVPVSNGQPAGPEDRERIGAWPGLASGPEYGVPLCIRQGLDSLSGTMRALVAAEQR